MESNEMKNSNEIKKIKKNIKIVITRKRIDKSSFYFPENKIESNEDFLKKYNPHDFTKNKIGNLNLYVIYEYITDFLNNNYFIVLIFILFIFDFLIYNLKRIFPD